ncbi:DMT family transporter [Arthrobacter sp. BL-252-APC-1A]|uniref:DMT family transporter n=1 Tax=Arthrobacter sp. BL-252-APC-1A TaxID=2606622 RepID=UPI001313C220|nr:DMT family transporter [Arthrobacter sp. BL-252-APC-1A]MSR98794.1 DMT family transporter [Arthrobacter sp. BL-252-APC-1A]
MSQPARLPAAVGLPVALAAGIAIPAQSRINGALGTALDDSLAAALVSFGVGLAVMILVSAVLPRGRAGFAQILPALRERRFPRVYIVAGVIGAWFVLTQTMTIALLGVAVFTVATVAGQTLTGLVVDRMGIGPGGKKTLTLMRMVGAVMTIAAVAWAVSPKLTDTGGTGDWLLAVLLPLSAGMAMSFQQAMNGTTGMHYGTPITATLLNFVSGFAALLVLWLIKVAVAGFGNPLPDTWWYYLGGPMGCIFIGVSAMLVKSLGVLLTSLGLIGGQLIGSLLLDIFVPAPGSVVVAATVLGTALTLAAIVVATLPWNMPGVRLGTGRRRPRARR